MQHGNIRIDPGLLSNPAALARYQAMVQKSTPSAHPQAGSLESLRVASGGPMAMAEQIILAGVARDQRTALNAASAGPARARAPPPTPQRRRQEAPAVSAPKRSKKDDDEGVAQVSGASGSASVKPATTSAAARKGPDLGGKCRGCGGPCERDDPLQECQRCTAREVDKMLKSTDHEKKAPLTREKALSDFLYDVGTNLPSDDSDDDDFSL